MRDFFDPQQNIDGGVRYLKFLLEKFNGDLDLSLAAYNAGENLVERLGRIPAIPETTNYVRKVRAIYRKKSAPVTVLNASPAVTAISAQAPSSKAQVLPREVLDAVPTTPAVHLCFGNYGGQSVQHGTWDRLLAYLKATAKN